MKYFRETLLSFLLGYASFPRLASGSTTDDYDFIIIGGGTAGLVVADRLANALPNASVAIVEAGGRVITNQTLVPETFEEFIGTAVDWNFTSIPQPHATNRSIDSPRGKLLGGTGIVNGMFYLRAHEKEYDAWEQLGNNGWNFGDINTRIKAVERYTPASAHDAATFAANDISSDHGTQGPVDVTYSTFWDPEPLITGFINSMAAQGINTTQTAAGGLPAGVFSVPTSVKPDNRSHDFYGEALVINGTTPSNLDVLLGAEVTKLQLSKNETSQEITATAMEYISNGTASTLTVSPTGKIILTAGTFQTPKILELSGIGNATLLDRFGISAQVDLPAVGENLQDHPFVVVSFEVAPGVGQSIEDLTRNTTYAAEQLVLYLHNRTGAYGSIPASTVAYVSVQDFTNATRLAELEEALDDSLEVFDGTAFQKQFAIQRTLLDDSTVPDLEIVFQPGVVGAEVSPNPNASHMSIAAILMHPFSRGSVHLASSDPLQLARLDPNYLGNDFDASVLAEAAKFIEKLSQTPPLSDLIIRQLSPAPNITDSQLDTYVRDTVLSSWHPVGPTSMLPEDQQGVVDQQLKVYGTGNIYVADSGIIPLSLATHPMATIYGIAHKVRSVFMRSADMGFPSFSHNTFDETAWLQP